MLGYYYALLKKMQNDISRLTSMQAIIQNSLSEFRSISQKSVEPELSSTTWIGKHASDFQDIRESSIMASYEEITDTQFPEIFRVIADKIVQINLEIESIKTVIATLEAAEEAERAAAAAKK